MAIALCPTIGAGMSPVIALVDDDRNILTPVIILTAKDDELDEALGLAMGADDYIAKPFSQRLLIARIRALLRRQDLAKSNGDATSDKGQEELPLIERGRLVMDPARHK